MIHSQLIISLISLVLLYNYFSGLCLIHKILQQSLTNWCWYTWFVKANVEKYEIVRNIIYKL